jgi:hypothetical protein
MKLINQFIVDKEILQFDLVSKLEAFMMRATDRMPLYENSDHPFRVNDPSEDNNNNLNQASEIQARRWLPANRSSVKLLRCIEAARDLTVSLGTHSLQEITPRIAKSFATPLYNLVVDIKDLYSELNADAKRYNLVNGPYSKTLKAMQQQFQQEAIGQIESLRIVRDKLHSHLDKEAIVDPPKYWRHINMMVFLDIAKTCVVNGLFLSTIEGVYAWKLNSSGASVLSITTEEFRLANFLIQNDEIVSLNTELIQSVKNTLISEYIPLINSYNKLVMETLPEKCFRFERNPDGTFNIGMPS